MKKILILSVIISMYGCLQLDASIESKQRAQNLVKIFYASHITNDFYAGERSSQDRKRLREFIMNDEENPYRGQDVNQHSLAQGLVCRARQVEAELAKNK